MAYITKDKSGKQIKLFTMFDVYYTSSLERSTIILILEIEKVNQDLKLFINSNIGSNLYTDGSCC